VEPTRCTPSTDPRANTYTMAEKETKKEVDPRQVRWDEHVANYAKANPTKYAAKKARGEFDTIPANFA
jgi:hypothetical protein